MSMIFQMDLSDLRKLKRFQKNAPREFRAATAGVLNSLAFSTRKLDIKNISRSMIIRNSKRTATIHSRKGSKRRQMLARARLKPGNKFYKPEQFQGKSLQRKFYFMMRVLGSRGGGEFLLSRNVPLKNGSLRRGLYSLRKSKIRRLQGFEGSSQPRRNPWHTKSLRMLSTRNDMRKVWQQNIDRVVRKYN